MLMLHAVSSNLFPSLSPLLSEYATHVTTSQKETGAYGWVPISALFFVYQEEAEFWVVYPNLYLVWARVHDDLFEMSPKMPRSRNGPSLSVPKSRCTICLTISERELSSVASQHLGNERTLENGPFSSILGRLTLYLNENGHAQD